MNNSHKNKSKSEIMQIDRKEIQKQKRMDYILDCAEKVCIEKGFANTTIEDVAKEAQYSKGTMYLYFKMKEEIFIHLIARSCKILYKIMKTNIDKENIGINKVKALGVSHYTFMAEYPHYNDFMNQLSNIHLDIEIMEDSLKELSKIDNDISQLMTECLDYGKKDGTISKEYETDKLMHFLKGTSTGIFMMISDLKKENKKDLSFNPDDLYKIYLEIVGKAISNN